MSSQHELAVALCEPHYKRAAGVPMQAEPTRCIAEVRQRLEVQEFANTTAGCSAKAEDRQSYASATPQATPPQRAAICHYCRWHAGRWRACLARFGHGCNPILPYLQHQRSTASAPHCILVRNWEGLHWRPHLHAANRLDCLNAMVIFNLAASLQPMSRVGRAQSLCCCLALSRSGGLTRRA